MEIDSNDLAAPKPLKVLSDPGSTLGGTNLQLLDQQAQALQLSLDFYDASSDDGEQLQTPLTDTSHVVHIAYPASVSCGPLSDEPSLSLTATGHQHAPSLPNCSFATPIKKSAPLYKDFNPTAHSSPPASSPALDPAMLTLSGCTTSLLDTRISLEDNKLDLYSPDASHWHVPHKPRPSQSFQAQRVVPPPLAVRVDRKILASTPRKRAPSTQHPQVSPHVLRKPKLIRSPASEFLPSTLGSSYCPRFPAGHRLRPDFVRQYKLDAELGAGGYGFVMTARHRFDGHEVAVKFIMKDKIPKHGWSMDDNGRNVPKEAKLLSYVHHTGIVKFYDLFEDEIYFYLVQELHGTPWQKRDKHEHQQSHQSPSHKDGPNENIPPVTSTPTRGTVFSSPLKEKCAHATLTVPSPEHLSFDMNVTFDYSCDTKAKKFLARPNFARRASHDLFECLEQSKHKRFAEKDAKYIFAQVVDVVDYLDKLGISHCDIKDENVVIDNNLRIKLIDFGSVVFADPSQPRPYLHRFFGTAAYASPEILTEKHYQAPTAEVWALGVLLSFLLTGLSPFRSDDDKRKGRIVLEKAHAELISAECLHLLRWCLEVDPNKRATITEVKDHSWLEGALDRASQ